MSELLPPSVMEALERLLALTREEGPLRDAMRHLAHAFLDATETPGQPGATGSHQPAPIGASDPFAPSSALSPEQAAPRAPVNEAPTLSIRDMVFQPYFGEPKRSTPIAPVESSRAVEPDDPRQIASRCLLKADAVRWRLRHAPLNGQLGSPATETDAEYAVLIERARQAQCYLWMVRDDAALRRDPMGAEQLAGCFEATGLAAHLASEALPIRERLRDEFLQTLELFAEAQSALRVAVRAFHPQGDDDAQLSAFLWLKYATATYQFYVRRHMKVDDPANPISWHDVVRRIQALEGSVVEVAKRSGQSKKLLGKLRHKVSVLLEATEERSDDWRILAETVDQLIQGGMPPSSLEIRELLLPLIDLVPELPETHTGFERVLREIDRYLASLPPPTTPASPRIDPLVEAAAVLVEGRSVVLIGGVPNPSSRQALRDTLRLREVYWPETREHQSISAFESEIARPDVCLVLLAIRWSSHSFGDVKHWCDQHDKPLVRLPRGYNPSQVAKEILDQASERLRHVGD